MELLKRGMDAESIRHDVFKGLYGEKELEDFEKKCHKYKTLFKLKYMCRKCQPK